MIVILKFLLAFTIFTALTKTFVLWAHIAGGNVFGVSLIFGVLNLLLCLFNFEKQKFDALGRQKVGFYIVLAFLLIVPFVFLIRGFYVKAYFLNVFYASYILIFITKSPWINRKYLSNIGWVSFATTIAAAFVSVIAPHLFTPFSYLIEGHTSYSGRAVGFYLQPNMLAYAVTLHFLFIAYLSVKGRGVALCGILAMACLFLTGSRSGFVLGGAVVVGVMLCLQGLKSFRKEFAYTVLSFLILGALLSPIIVPKIKPVIVDTTERMTLFFSSGAGALKSDGSVVGRETLRNFYFGQIRQKPLLGHGYAASTSGAVTGKVIGAPHNMYLEYLYNGGVVYLIFYIPFIMAPVFSIKLWRGDWVRTTILLALPCFLLLYGFMINTLEDERALYVLLGVIYWGASKRMESKGLVLRK